MKRLDLNKADAAARDFFNRLKAENLIGDHDLIVLDSDHEFHIANSSIVKLSERTDIIRAYRIDSGGVLWLA